MSCDREQLLQAYHDGELDVPARASVETHVAQCDSCRRSLTELRSISGLMSNFSFPLLPAGAVMRFHAAWDDAQSYRDRAVLRIASWLTALAAAILVGGLISLNWPVNGHSAPGRVGQWETAAVLPPVDVSAESGATTELVRVAQWQADDLAVGEKR